MYPPTPSLFVFIIILLMSSFLFLTTGLLITIPLFLNKKLSPNYFLISSLLASCFIGYLTFMIFVIDERFGKVFLAIIYFSIAIEAIWVVRAFIKKRFSKLTQKTLLHYFLISVIAVTIAGLYGSILYSCTTHGEVVAKEQYCNNLDNTFDNTLPLTFAQAVYQGKGHASVSDWTITDRPPLQSGLLLVQMPIAARVGGLVNYYQVLSVLLQCLWVYSLYEFIKRTKVKASRAGPMFVISITSFFIFSNSIFVWPKLLAGALGIFAFIIIFDAIKNKALTTERIFLLALSFSLGMLAHGGLIFTLLPLAFYLFFKFRKFVDTKKIVLLAIISLVLYTPWLFYKSTNSNGDRLMNWWISGKVEKDDRMTHQVLIDAYKDKSIIEIANYKLGNIKALFGIMEHKDATSAIKSSASINNSEVSFFIPSLAFSLLGLGLLIKDYINKLIENNHSPIITDIAKTSLFISLVSVIFWVLVSYGPPNAPTIAYAGSYATFLLLFFALLLHLSTRKFISIVAAVSSIYFICINALIYKETDLNLNLAYLLMACVLVAILYFMMGLIFRMNSFLSQSNGK